MKLRTKPFALQFKFVPHIGQNLMSLAAEPFPFDDLQRRPLTTNKENTKGMPAYYIDPRALDYRMNLIFSGDWQLTTSSIVRDGVVIATTSLQIGNTVRQEVSSEKIGSDPNLATTSAFAASYKRSAAKFGIGAYLYELKQMPWLDLKPGTRFFKDKDMTEAEWNAMPGFAKPRDIKVICTEHLQLLFNTTDKVELKNQMSKFFGIDTLTDVGSADTWRLTALIARTLDYMDCVAGITLDELYKMATMKPNGSSMGFNNG